MLKRAWSFFFLASPAHPRLSAPRLPSSCRRPSSRPARCRSECPAPSRQRHSSCCHRGLPAKHKQPTANCLVQRSDESDDLPRQARYKHSKTCREKRVGFCICMYVGIPRRRLPPPAASRRTPPSSQKIPCRLPSAPGMCPALRWPGLPGRRCGRPDRGRRGCEPVVSNGWCFLSAFSCMCPEPILAQSDRVCMKHDLKLFVFAPGAGQSCHAGARRCTR